MYFTEPDKANEQHQDKVHLIYVSSKYSDQPFNPAVISGTFAKWHM